MIKIYQSYNTYMCKKVSIIFKNRYNKSEFEVI